MRAKDCTFATQRLSVRAWHTPPVSDAAPANLEQIVMGLLSEPVTRSLPETWRGHYSPERARAWICARDAEGTTALVLDRESGEAIGLLFVDALPTEGGRAEMRVGYLLAESRWGRGLASELVTGLVGWAHKSPDVDALVGGVATDNPASSRVLKKNGFQVFVPEAGLPLDTLMWRLEVKR